MRAVGVDKERGDKLWEMFVGRGWCNRNKDVGSTERVNTTSELHKLTLLYFGRFVCDREIGQFSGYVYVCPRTRTLVHCVRPPHTCKAYHLPCFSRPHPRPCTTQPHHPSINSHPLNNRCASEV